MLLAKAKVGGKRFGWNIGNRLEPLKKRLGREARFLTLGDAFSKSFLSKILMERPESNELSFVVGDTLGDVVGRVVGSRWTGHSKCVCVSERF